jgi:hypothetical protein
VAGLAVPAAPKRLLSRRGCLYVLLAEPMRLMDSTGEDISSHILQILNATSSSVSAVDNGGGGRA